VDYLNLFINSLVNEDRGVELDFMRPKDKEDEIKQEHAEFIRMRIDGEKMVSTGKINTVCEALKAELQIINVDNNYLLPILTISVKK
jgi:hypothetical protein